MTSCKVSILMPVKNEESFLDECLQSIICQTLTNWELIAINDNSDDNSLKILTHYSNKDSRIKIYNNNKNGIISALQLAYSKSDGDLITRMDGDDIMSNNKLQILYDSIIDTEYCVAVGKVSYFSTGKKLNDGYKKYENWLNQLSVNSNNFAEIYKECVIPSPCWMMKKKDFAKIGAFNSNIYPEDYDLAFRMYINNIKVIGNNNKIHYWRDHPDRASRNDINYSNNTFSKIKIKYFLLNDYKKSTVLIVWGAGKKGKAIAKQLINESIDFEWVTENPKKISKNIYGKIIKNSDIIFHSKIQIQIIIAVASKEFNPFINNTSMNSIYYFC